MIRMAATAGRMPAPTVPIAATSQAPTTGATAATAASIANRRAMPQVATVVDQLRQAFGPVKVVFAEEGGRRLGTAPAASKEGCQ